MRARSTGFAQVVTLAAIVLIVTGVGRPVSASANAVVTLFHDVDESGSGTNLRQAIAATPDQNSLINTITFQCGGPATISFTIGGPLEIFQATSIDGGSSVALTSAIPSSRNSLFVVANPGSFLYLNNLTLSHTNTDHPICIPPVTCPSTVINGQGITQLNNVTIEDSYSPLSVTSGTLTISQSRFTGNSGTVVDIGDGVTTTVVGSSFQNNSDATPMVARGVVSITGSQFVGNGSASFFPGACQLSIDGSEFRNNSDAALQINCGATTISNSLFANNSAARVGGAIRFFAGARQIELRADRFLSNSAPAGGGALWLAPPENGDIAILIDFSIFKGNRSGNLGGAVDIEKSADLSKTIVRLRRASFSRNTADRSGGAIAASDAQLLASQTVFADNSAKQQGGAVALNNARPLHSVLANSLFVRNSAPNGGAFSGDDSDFINSTVDSNAGVAIANAASHPPVHIKLANTIVSNNSQGGCGPAGLFDDGRRNLQFPSADCGASIDVANPHLDSMYIPLPKSPPSGAGDMTVCMHQPVDGRDIYGSARGSSGTCAIGAAENLLLRQASGGNSGGCNCGRTLVDRLRRALPFGQ